MVETDERLTQEEKKPTSREASIRRRQDNEGYPFYGLIIIFVAMRKQ